MGRPKTLAERLEWMAKNLPGFREEMATVDEIQKQAQVRKLNSLALQQSRCLEKEFS